MLPLVAGSSLLCGPQVATRAARVVARWFVALGALLPLTVGAAQAQQTDGGGWFDPPVADPVPEADSARVAVVQQSDGAVAQGVPDTDPSALTTFRPALDPYGSWVDDSTYGTVWVPNRELVGADFAPYASRGRWVLTADDDWMWESDYPFGWAVFHYGRWVWVQDRGWAWVPGRTYANAWVVWRVPSARYAYVGWAPMPPTWGWYGGYAFGLWYSPPVPYVFCPSAYVFDRRVHYHIVRDRRLVSDLAAHSRVYPTPYRAPAQPSLHGSSGARPAAVGSTLAPRGPGLSAARVPAQAVPSLRSSPPADAVRLAGAVRLPASNTERFMAPGGRVPSSSDSLPRNPQPRRTFRAEQLPDSARSHSPAWTEPPRTLVPARVRAEPRSPAPVRMRVSPSGLPGLGPPSRGMAPSFHHRRH